MKFDTEKLKKMARPMSAAEREELEYREDNREWLALSEKLALKVRYFIIGKTKRITFQNETYKKSAVLKFV